MSVYLATRSSFSVAMLQPEQCGIIAFYRAQVWAIKSLLGQRLQGSVEVMEGEGDGGAHAAQQHSIKVATVDSFQVMHSSVPCIASSLICHIAYPALPGKDAE